MKRSPRLVLPTFLLLLCAFLLSGCDGNPSADANDATLSGVVYAPNGVDPIPGAEVRAVPVARAGTLSAQASWNPGPASAISGPDGSFTIGGLASGAYQLVITHGLFSKSASVSVSEGGQTQLPAAQTTLPASSGGGDSAPRIAVVTGAYDEMANVLAKFGMGQVDSHGTLILGTERFSIYVDSTGRPIWDAEIGDYGWEDYPASYPPADDLFRNLAAMRQYDVIVVNCGVDETRFLVPGEPGVRSNLREFVRLGGKLYVTDLSNHFVEQTFPGFLRYEGADNTAPSDPEPMYGAWVGEGGTTSDASVLDPVLAGWLRGLGALDGNGILHIEDFAGGWAVLSGPEPTDEGAQVKVWVEGPVVLSQWVPGGGSMLVDNVVRPLTVSFPFGYGKVIYTSYHTASMPHAGFTPQERVLEYLLLQ